MSGQQPMGDKGSRKRNLIDILRHKYGKLETLKFKDVEDFGSKLKDNSDLSMTELHYMCATQPSMPKHPDLHPSEIFVGLWGIIPRWHKGDTVNYAAYAGGYPTPNHARFAAYRLFAAAEIWNGKNVGVKFKWVDKLEDAAFVLAYGGNGGDTLAKAFFPNREDLNTMFVYQLAFQPNRINYMTNVFLHELGHVMGVRHEFADQEGGAIQWGSRNPLSVMSYVMPPQIQPSDVTDLTSFYNYTQSTYGTYTMDYIHPDN